MSNVTIKKSKTSAKLASPVQKASPPSDAELEIKAEWNPILAVFLGAVIFFGAQLLSALILSYYRYPKHWSAQQLLNWLNNAVSAQFLYYLFAECLVVLAVYLFVRRYKDGLRAIGLRQPRWFDLVYGLAGLPMYLFSLFVAVTIIQHLVPSLNVNEKQQLGFNFNNVHGGGETILIFLSLVVLPPIGEEILFRGFLYSSLKKNLPKVIAVLATSALFATPHLFEGGSAGLLYIAAIDTFILSLFLILLREKSGGLWSSMILHALKNSIAFFALFATYIH